MEDSLLSVKHPKRLNSKFIAHSSSTEAVQSSWSFSQILSQLDGNPYSVLANKLGADFVAATIAATAVSPFVAIIDRAISVNASGLDSMSNSMKSGFEMLVRRPILFARQPYFLCILGVFVGTYATANCSEQLLRHYQFPVEYPKFSMTSSVNITLSVRKDAIYTRWFGNPAIPKRAIPLATWILFSIRDAMTMVSSFVLPPYIATYVKAATNLPSKTSLYLSQFAAPILIQIISTPINLYGLHLYNVPVSSTLDRMIFIKQEYLKTLSLRMGRILPAFGIGGVVNTRLREVFKTSSINV